MGTSLLINGVGMVYDVKKDRLVVPCMDSHCYFVINVRRYGKYRILKIATLVAEAFIPNPHKRNEVNHKNAIRSDDRVENLEWCTHKENMQHSFKMGNRFWEKNPDYIKGKKKQYEQKN